MISTDSIDRKAYHREYYLKNKDRLLAGPRNDPDFSARRNSLRRAHYEKNRERILAYNRERVASNIDRTRELARERYKRERINVCVRSGVRYSLRGNKGGQRTWQMLGYTLDDLKAHLERQFTRGMSWDNYGEWHIDHIVPLSAFDINAHTDPDFARAWALTNLRPLWAAENMRKRNNRLFLL